MHMQDLIGGIEAILFASANPMTEVEVRKVVARWVASLPPEAAHTEDACTSTTALGDGEHEGFGSDAAAKASGCASSQAAATHDLAPNPQAQADGDIVEPVHMDLQELGAEGAGASPDAAPLAAPPTEGAGNAQADGTFVQRSASASAHAECTEETEVRHASTSPNDPMDLSHTRTADGAKSVNTAASGAAAQTCARRGQTGNQAGEDESCTPESLGAIAETSSAANDASPSPETPAASHGFDWRKNFKAALAALKMRWQNPHEFCGFTLVEVADALAFRSNSRFAPALLAMRDEKPPRLSRAAMETLAIIAYRQPVTKPESDHIRGVDCGGTIKMLLDRNLIRIVGKKEEAGRPLLYGTGPEFLSFFNLSSVHHLPSLRAFDELNDDSEEALRELDGLPSLQQLSAQAKQFRLNDEPAMGTLDAAVDALRRTESTSREALAAQGISLGTDDDDGPLPTASLTQH